MRPAGLHHVSLNVSDLETAVRFYTGALGLTLRTDRPDLDVEGVWLDVGSQQVHLIVNPPPANHGQHFAIAVDDLDGAVRELTAAGVAVRGPFGVGAARQAFLADPDGNRIELQGR